MSGSVFVDSNVLVYARDASEPDKQPLAETWLAQLWRTRSGRVSMQVLHEFYVTVTQKLRPGLPVETARRDVRALLAWDPLPLTTTVLDLAWSAQDQHDLAFWDALIVAAARSAGCRYLLTEDLSDGQELGGVVVVDPFRHGPDGIA